VSLPYIATYLQQADEALENMDDTSTPSDSEELLDLFRAILREPRLRQRIHELVHALAHGHEVVLTLADDDLTSTQAALRLGCSRKHVNKMIAAGTLRAYRLPESDHQRIPAAEVLRILQQRDEQFWSPLTDLPGPEAFRDALARSRRRVDAIQTTAGG